jgi:hypothetical protein
VYRNYIGRLLENLVCVSDGLCMFRVDGGSVSDGLWMCRGERRQCFGRTVEV